MQQRPVPSRTPPLADEQRLRLGQEHSKAATVGGSVSVARLSSSERSSVAGLIRSHPPGRGHAASLIALVGRLQQVEGNRAVQRLLQWGALIDRSDAFEQLAAGDNFHLQKVIASLPRQVAMAGATQSRDHEDREPLARELVRTLRNDPGDRAGRARARIATLSPAVRKAVLEHLAGKISPVQLALLASAAAAPDAVHPGELAAEALPAEPRPGAGAGAGAVAQVHAKPAARAEVAPEANGRAPGTGVRARHPAAATRPADPRTVHHGAAAPKGAAHGGVHTSAAHGASALAVPSGEPPALDLPDIGASALAGYPVIGAASRAKAQDDANASLVRLEQRLLMARERLDRDGTSAQSRLAVRTERTKTDVVADASSAKERASAAFVHARSAIAGMFSAASSETRALLTQARRQVIAAQTAEQSRLQGGSTEALGKLRDAGAKYDRDAAVIGAKEANRATVDSNMLAGQSDSMGQSRAAAAPADISEALAPGLRKLGSDTATHIRNAGNDTAKGARDTAAKAQGAFAQQAQQMLAGAQQVSAQAQAKLHGAANPVLEKIDKLLTEVLPKLETAHKDVGTKLDEAEKNALADIGESQAGLLNQLDHGHKEAVKAIQMQAKTNDRKLTEFAQAVRARIQAEKVLHPEALRRLVNGSEQALEQRVAAFRAALQAASDKLNDSAGQTRQGFNQALAQGTAELGRQIQGITGALGTRLGAAKSTLAAQTKQLVDGFRSGVNQAVTETQGKLSEMNATLGSSVSQALQKTGQQIAGSVDIGLDHNRAEFAALPGKMDQLQARAVAEKKKGFWAKVWDAIKDILKSVMFWVGVLLMIVVIAIGAYFGAAAGLIAGLILLIPFAIYTVYRRIQSLWQDDAPWYKKLAYFILILNPFTGPAFILLDTMGIFGLVEGGLGVDIVTGRKLSEDEAAQRMASGIVGVVMILISLGLSKVVPVRGGGVEPPINEPPKQLPPGPAPPKQLPPGPEPPKLLPPGPIPQEAVPPEVVPPGPVPPEVVPPEVMPPEPKPSTPTAQVPKSWAKFKAEFNEVFKARLAKFRGNDDLAPDASGGEGKIFANGSKLALKRWFAKILDSGKADEGIALLEEAKADVDANPNLAKDVEVVKIHEKGPDWILRDFDPMSVELRDGDATAQAARARAIAELEAQQKRGGLSDALRDILKKLKKEPPSANLHWSPSKGKIIVIDMR